MSSIDSSAPSPFDQEVTEFRDLRDRLSLAGVMTRADELSDTITPMAGKLAGLRGGGYAYKNFLEGQVEALAQRWSGEYAALVDAAQGWRPRFDAAAAEIDALHARRSPAGERLTRLAGEVERAERELEARLAPVDAEAGRLAAQLDDIAWTLAQAGQASFAFEAGEAPVEAAPANWKKPDDRDGVDGVLFLTDRRLIFEQKEEVATKKVLFVTTAKEKVQALAWAAPLEQVQQVKGEKRGLFGKDDFLVLTFAAGAPLPCADVHLKGESGEAWAGFIHSVKSGAAGRERTVVSSGAAPARVGLPAGMGEDILLMQTDGDVGLTVGTELALDEMHAVAVYRDGQALDLVGPGKRVLNSDSLPLLCGEGGLGAEPVWARLAFVTIRDIANVKWGTPMPVTLRAADAAAGYVSVVMYGMFYYRVADPALAVRQMLNESRPAVTRDEMRTFLQSYVVQGLTIALGKLTGGGQMALAQLMQLPDELNQAAREEIAPLLAPFGVELRDFYVENVRQVG